LVGHFKNNGGNMKIRSGFVSNSSSSSFLIYGAFLNSSDIKELLKLSEEEQQDELDYILQERTGFEVHAPIDDYDDGYYIGRSYDSIGDDETGKQFKESVEKKLEEVFGKKIECSVHEESWYNG